MGKSPARSLLCNQNLGQNSLVRPLRRPLFAPGASRLFDSPNGQPTTSIENIGIRETRCPTCMAFRVWFHKCCNGFLSTEWLTLVQSVNSPSSNYPPWLSELAAPSMERPALMDPGSAGLDPSYDGLSDANPTKDEYSAMIRSSSITIEAISAIDAYPWRSIISGGCCHAGEKDATHIPTLIADRHLENHGGKYGIG